MPKLVVQQELKKNWIQTVEVNDLTIPFEYYIAHRKNYNLTHYEQMFVDFIFSSKRGFC